MDVDVSSPNALPVGKDSVPNLSGGLSSRDDVLARLASSTPEEKLVFLKSLMLACGVGPTPVDLLVNACSESILDANGARRWFELIWPLRRGLLGLPILHAESLHTLESLALTDKVTLFVTSSGDLVGDYIRALANDLGMDEEELRRLLVPNLPLANGEVRQMSCGKTGDRPTSLLMGIVFVRHPSYGLVPAALSENSFASSPLAPEDFLALIENPPSAMPDSLLALLKGCGSPSSVDGKPWLLRFSPRLIALIYLNCEKVLNASPLEGCRLVPGSPISMSPIKIIRGRGMGGPAETNFSAANNRLAIRVGIKWLCFRIKDWDHLVCLIMLLLSLRWSIFSMHLQMGIDKNSGLVFGRDLMLNFTGSKRSNSGCGEL